MKRKWIRYLLKALIAFVCGWMILLAAALIYIKINKQKIVASVRASFTKKVSGNISFADFAIDPFHNFPGISIDVKEFHLQDSTFHSHQHELVYAQHIYMGFGIIELLTGKKVPKYVRVTNSKFFFFADSVGNKNWDILKRSQPQSRRKIDLKKVTFRNTNVFFEDDRKFKFHNVWFQKLKCSIRDKDERLEFEIECSGVVKNASFDTKKGSYLTNKNIVGEWEVSYDRLAKEISLRNQLVRLDKQPYRVTADFFLDSDPRFTLDIKTNNLSLTEGASIFPPATAKMIGSYQLSKSLQKVEAVLSGKMKYLYYPLAKISFSVKDASLTVAPTRFDHCSFNGFLQNEIDSSKLRDDHNSFLQFTNLTGEWEKTRFSSKNLTIYNLIQPYLRCDLHAIFDLAQLEKAIANRKLDLNSGTGEAKIVYEGPLETSSDTVYNLNGVITISHGDITYNPRNLNFKQTDIELFFRNGDMEARKMNTVANDNVISINGRVDNFLNFFNTDPSKAIFNWHIYSPDLDISKLRSSLHRKSVVKNKHGYSFFDRLTNKIDRLFDDCSAYITIEADKVIYKKFSAANVKGRLALTNNVIRLDNFSLSHAGGFIYVNASSKDNGNTSDLAIQSKLDNVNVKELFRSFNNFGLHSLTSENISGNFSADINLTSMLDANNDLYREANKGYVDFSLKNGRLLNFAPLVEIDNNFLQKRNLTDVTFSELKDRFDLNGNDVHINRMEIRSTAVNMYVEGVYSFANNTDISIQVPLQGQKKDQTETPENKGVNAKTGISIFLRAKDDKDGKLKIKYDMFGKFRKNKTLP
jgi:AsmA-like protein